MNVYKLNVNSNIWEQFSDLKSARVAHQSTTIGDQLYLIAGNKNVNHYAADTETIPISKEFKGLRSTFPEMHNERKYFGMCSFAGCVFVAGGCHNDIVYLDKCEVYSFHSCEWIEISSMNTKRAVFPLVFFQDKIWAIAGFSGTTKLDTMETFDIAENKWTTVDTKLLSKRCNHSAVANNKKFFVIGGVSQDGMISSVEVYSSETSQFSFVTSMNLSRTNFGCCIVKSKVYVVGGLLDWDKRKATDEVEVYDIENDVWNKGPSLPLKLASVGCSTSG